MAPASQHSTESELLEALGIALLHTCADLSTSILFYGIFVLLFAQAIITNLKVSRLGHSRICIFAIIIMTFTLATIHLITLLAGTGIIIRSALIEYQDVPLIEKPPLVNNLMMKWVILHLWTNRFATLISDGIVVWRAFVLLRSKGWLIIFPSILLLGSAALALGYLVLASMGADLNHGTANTLSFVSLGLSFGTNIVTTALVGYVYWSHRKSMKACFGDHAPTRTERALELLVESGILFCIPQAVYFVLGFFPQHGNGGKNTAGAYAQTVWSTVYFGVAFIYPTMFIVLVNSKYTSDSAYSTRNSYQASNRRANDTGIPIRFASPEPSISSGSFVQPVEKRDDVIVTNT